MKLGQLSKFFTGVAAKHLSAVEVDPSSSNQHEFNGAAPLKQLFGESRMEMAARFLYLDDSAEPKTAYADLTWYDARERHEKRTEHRLYYSADAQSIIGKAGPGDLLVIGKRTDDDVLVVVAKKGSTAEQQLKWLFDLEIDGHFVVKDQKEIEDLEDAKTQSAAAVILDELGIEAIQPDGNWLEIILKTFGPQFPSTLKFSEFAFSTFEKDAIDSIGQPDAALTMLMDRETALFKTLERYQLEGVLKKGFKDADEFISYSLHIQNRRKSRAGFALENHLQMLFEANKIKYARGQVTENNNKPDFIFPSIEAYREIKFPQEKLTFLGAKTTCKDRWRQVLSEADRIDKKHLLTLEPGISAAQTDEMKAKKIHLVIPKGLHSTFTTKQQPELLDLETFISLVKAKDN